MRQLFIVIFLFFSFNIYAQVDIINESLVANSPDILYIGIENNIKISPISADPYRNIHLKGGGSAIAKIEAGRYAIKVYKKDTCILSVTNTRGKVVLRKKYLVEALPYPVATLNKLKDTSISKKRIQLNPYVIAILPGCYYNHKYRVHSFEATFVTSGDSTKTTSAGYTLSKEQLNLLEQLNTGDKIIFDEIILTCENGRNTKIPGFWLKIQ